MIGIVLLGGIARGYADKYSDIDIIVFTERNVDLGIPRESEISVKVPEEDYKKYGINVVTIDYEIIEYNKASEEKWDLEKRWAYSFGKVIYDPEGKIKKLLGKKIIFPDDECFTAMIEGIVQCEYFAENVPRKWIYRGDLVSAHFAVFLSILELLKGLFALNKRLIPANPWILWCSKFLDWLPDNFMEKIKEALLVKAFTNEDLERRINAIKYLLAQVIPVIERKTGRKFEDLRKMV